MAGKAERRYLPAKDLELRARDGGGSTLRGYAAVFDVLSEDLGGFREKIAPGAFAAAIGRDDVRALWNHNSDFVLGRNVAGTLRLFEDGHGLGVEIDLPETQIGRDAATSIARGDVSQMSFGFYTEADAWAKVGGLWERTLLELSLFDVSPVTYPAYPQTEVMLRALAPAREALELARGIDAAEVVRELHGEAVFRELRRRRQRLAEIS